jgi:hypothetical protein
MKTEDMNDENDDDSESDDISSLGDVEVGIDAGIDADSGIDVIEITNESNGYKSETSQSEKSQSETSQSEKSERLNKRVRFTDFVEVFEIPSPSSSYPSYQYNSYHFLQLKD